MKTSPTGLAFIAKWEGEVLHVYKDVAGIATIGVGHALRPGDSFPDGITHEQALALLAGDVQIAEHAVNALVEQVDDRLSQNAFDACVSFTFNCGGGAFERSTIRTFINAGDFQSAARAFLLWDHRKDPKSGALVEDGGLFARRAAERDLFLKPDDDDNPYEE